MSGFDWDEVTPWIDPDGCLDCGACIFVCPVDAIKDVPAGTVSVGNESWYTPGRKRIDTDDCIECGSCEPECPYEAIYILGSGSGGSVPPPTSGGGGGASNQSDIVNNTEDPCIKKTVHAAIAANKDIVGKMADIIKNFDSSKNVKINVYDDELYYKDANGNSTGVPKPGETNSQTFIGNQFNANIVLGTNFHANTSKENIVATLIHETIHAYLGYTSNNFLKTETDHNVIANKYITPMADYLRQYFGIPLKEAYALAWSGVPDAKAYTDAGDDFEYTMSDGNKITKAETRNLSGPYKLPTNVPANNGFTKGTKICD